MIAQAWKALKAHGQCQALRLKTMGEEVHMEEMAKQEQEQAERKMEETPKQEEQKSEEKKYTDAEVNAIIDKKFAKWQKDQEEKITEAQKLAEMNAQQKVEYERDQLRKQLKEYEKANTMAEMTKTARTILKEDGINAEDELLTLLVSEDAEHTQKAVKAFAELYKASVEAEVNERLRSSTPRRGTTTAKITKEQIAQIKDPVERRRLIAENPELYQN